LSRSHANNYASAFLIHEFAFPALEPCAFNYS
jgi:hypothetical protein